MSDVAATPPAEPVAPSQPLLYATFPRRLNALSVDAVVVMLASVVLFALMPALQSVQPLPGLLLVLWFVLVFLYEPVQVSRFGGTVGHRAMNLKVVDDRTGTNPTFGKALGRAVVKGLLGVLSFVTMGLSRRHRALQDMATLTTVQIRDPRRALPFHYVLELPPPPAPGGS